MRRAVKNRWWTRLAALALVLTLTVPAAGAAPVIYGYQEGLAKASENGLWGFADPSGGIAIPIRFQSVLDFSLGTALVQSGKKMGLIRQDGTYLLSPEYDTLESIGYGLYLAQKGDAWGVVSMLPFPSKLGGDTQELYPIVYDRIRVDRLSGLDVLIFTTDGVDTALSLSRLTALMEERQVPSARFPLIKGRLPSFSDVKGRDWFSLWVDLAYNVNLMQGVGDGRFAPQQTLTVAEAIKLAAFMESQATGDTFHLQSITGSPWYRSSVTYCEASGIINPGEFTDFERNVTRAEMARIFAATTLGRGIPEINSMNRVKASVPDVKAGDYAANAIFSLYAKGILSGTDGKLTFNPNASLTRAEAAAIVSRMARTEQRVLIWPGKAAYRSAGGGESAPEPPAGIPMETALH